MTEPGRRSRWAAWALVVVVAVAGLLLVAASLQPYEYALKALPRLSPVRRVSRLTEETYRTVTQDVGAVGGALLLAALGLGLARRRVARGWETLAKGCRSMRREAKRLWRGLLGDPLHAWTLLALTLIAAAIRLVYLSRPMRSDEAITYLMYASRPFYRALVSVPYYPNNHPLHTLLVRGASLLLGDQPWALRMPAFLAGVACVPAVYLAARRLYGKAPALVAATLVAASSALVGFSTNAWGYTLVCLESLLLLALATYLYRSRNAAGWLAFALLGALGLFTVPTMIYPLGMVAMWLGLMTLVTQPRRLWGEQIGRLLGYTILAGILAAVLYTPIVAAGGLNRLVANRFVAPLAWGEFARQLPASLRGVATLWHQEVPLPLTVLLVVGVVVAVVAHRRVSRYPVSVAGAAVLWLAPVLVAQHVVPFVRVWLFLLPVYLMLAAAGLCFLLGPLVARAGRRRELVWVALALALAVGLGSQVARRGLVSRSGAWHDVQAVTLTLQGELQPGDLVLYDWLGEWPLKYYFTLQGLPLEYLTAEPRAAWRLWVAVAEGPEHWPLPQILQASGLREEEFGPPQTVQRYSEATLYLLPWR